MNSLFTVFISVGIPLAAVVLAYFALRHQMRQRLEEIQVNDLRHVQEWIGRVEKKLDDFMRDHMEMHSK